MRRHLFSGLLILFGFLLALLVNPTQSQTPCDETSGRTERNFYRAVQTQMAYSVYLPPCYDQSTDVYPVMYLFHGSNDDDEQWIRLGLPETLDTMIADGEIQPVIAVMPFGNWMANENTFHREGWGNVFVDEVMSRAESMYRIDARRESRVIGGISRGGFWAFHIALKNPELFSAIGGHSAFFDRFHAPPEENPLDLVLIPENTANMRIYLDYGADDYAAPGLQIMRERLTEANVPHEYVTNPVGQHANSYWREHVREYVTFYTANWTDDPPPRPIFVTNTPHSVATVSSDTVTAQPTTRPTATATPMPQTNNAENTENGGDGVELFLPVVVFPSIEASIPLETVQNVIAGQTPSNLVLSEATVAALNAQGINVSGRIVADDALYNMLFRDRTLFTILPFDRLEPRYRVLRVDEVHPLDMPDYPLAFASDTPNFDPARLTRITLSGVTALTRGTLRALDANGIEWAAEAILPYVQTADFFHTSNEVSIYENCPQFNNETLGGNSSFCSRPEHFDLLTLLDVDIVELSGNHNNDFGYEVYRDTLAWYDERGIFTVGGGETLDEAYRPLDIAHNSNDVAMLACNWVGPYYALVNEDESLAGGVRPGAADCSSPRFREALTAVEADVVIVTVQYQEVDDFVPPESASFDFRTLVDWGADVVVGTSSHFPQPHDFYAPDSEQMAFIHYGLGNFLFDQTFFGGVRFFMDQLFIYDGALVAVDLFTGIIEGQGRPRPMTPDERRNFLFLIFNEHGGF